jgi:hypothetical protein
VIDKSRAVTIGFLIDLLKDIADATREHVAKAIDSRYRSLEERVTALEQRPLSKWYGSHEPGRSYHECAMVTRAGGIWVATTETTETPGNGATAWRLVVKSGQAPRD